MNSTGPPSASPPPIPPRTSSVAMSIASVLNSMEDCQFDYENLYNLEDHKIGLINKALFANSKIKQSEKLTECSICKEEIFLDIIRELNCTHYFHINCIDTWLSEKYTMSFM